MKKTTKRTFNFGMLILVLIVLALIVRNIVTSKVIANKFRFNMVFASSAGDVLFASFDPEEKQVFTVTYPQDLEIKSRSVGTYKMGSLYTRGHYEDDEGQFIRRKVQGFMRVPIVGFMPIEESGKTPAKSVITKGLIKNIFSLSSRSNIDRLDSAVLYVRAKQYEWHEGTSDELIRNGVLVRKGDAYTYDQERLKQYLGSRIFDWAVGAHNATVAVVNGSEEDGLGSDVAEFLSNLGFDIVAVKAGEEVTDRTVVEYVSEPDKTNAEILTLFGDLFGWHTFKQAESDQYRAQYVVKLGKDALGLF